MPRPFAQPLLRWIGAVALLAAIALVVAGFATGRIHLQAVIDAIVHLNGAVVFCLIAILPIFGFSIGAAYLVAGVKFGPYAGGLVVAIATAIHLVASRWIGQGVLREPLLRWLGRRHHRLPHVPQGADAALAAIAALVPGIPYFARNYLLALTDVPLRYYLAVCLPIYVIRSYVPILLGGMGASVTRRGLMVLGVIYGLKLLICALLLAYIRWRMTRATAVAGPPSAHNAGDSPSSPEAGESPPPPLPPGQTGAFPSASSQPHERCDTARRPASETAPRDDPGSS